MSGTEDGSPGAGSAGDPPVLKIKRDAVQELRFHYDLDRRVQLRRPRPEPRRGLFGRLFRGGRRPGRGLRSLLPVLLGVLAIVVAMVLLQRDRATGHLAGYDVSLRAYAYETALLASVTVSWNPVAGEQVSEAADATVRFSTSAEGSGTVATEPLGGGEAMVRGRLAGTGAQRRVVAEVAIGGKALRLSAAVGKP